MRKIIHIDADCFFAAVEERDNSSLRGRPIAVGGAPDRRGVIATCSYSARVHGVRSAMSSAQAKRLCPDLMILKPNMAKYQQASQQLMAILHQYSDAVEPLSLDEAFLDVSESPDFRGSATLLAKALKLRIKREVGITVSAGIAPVKFLAKVASDWLKPDGLFVVLPEQVESFTANLPVQRLPGVGPVTVSRLHRQGLYHCKDIKQFGQAAMIAFCGALGEELFNRACGIDDRRVLARSERKSISVERTFAKDLSVANIPEAVDELMTSLMLRCQKVSADQAIRKAFVKVKFADFKQTSVEVTTCRRLRDLGCMLAESDQPSPTPLYTEMLTEFQRLSVTAWQREKNPIRLLGIGVGFDVNQANPQQLRLSQAW